VLTKRRAFSHPARFAIAAVCSLMAVALFVASFVPLAPQRSKKLAEVYCRGWRIFSRLRTTSLVLNADPYSSCPLCGLPTVDYPNHAFDCPNLPGINHLSLMYDSGIRDKWFAIPGFTIWTNPAREGFTVVFSTRLISLLFALIPAIMLIHSLRLRRLVRLGHCLHCTYNLTGNTSGVCPECGTPTAPRP